MGNIYLNSNEGGGVKCILGKRWRNWLEAAGHHKLLPCKVFNLTQDEIDGGLRQYLDLFLFFLWKKPQSYHIISCVAITTLGDWDKMTARGPFWLLPRHRNSLICSPITATVLWPPLSFWHESTSSSNLEFRLPRWNCPVRCKWCSSRWIHRANTPVYVVRC